MLIAALRIRFGERSSRSGHVAIPVPEETASKATFAHSLCIVWGLLNHRRSSTDAGRCFLDFPDPTEMISLVTALATLWAASPAADPATTRAVDQSDAVPLEADTRIWIQSQIDRCEESGAAGIRAPTAPGFSTMPAPVDWTQGKAKSVGIFYRFRFADQGPVLSRQPNGWLIGDLES